MKLEEMHGRDIEVIYLEPDGELRPDKEKKERLYLSSEYYGDHSENWVILESDGGHEILHHNTKYIDTIIWK